MSDLDYDALRKVAETGARVTNVKTSGSSNPTSVRGFPNPFDPLTVLRLIDLARRAEAAEATVQRVREVTQRWADGIAASGPYGELDSDEVVSLLREALDPKESKR